MSVDLNKDLTGLDKDQISQYLGDIENEIRSRKNRLNIIKTRLLKLDKIQAELKMSREKAIYNVQSMNLYYETVKRNYWDKKGY